MDRPLSARVSVIIPAYNADAYLAATLEALQAQTVTDWVATVIDDGSHDRTAEIAEQFAAQDPRIRVLRQASNSGLSAARNRGMREAPAEYFAFLDADDIWTPNKLERQLAAAEQTGVDFVFCSYMQFDDGGRQWEDHEWQGRLGRLEGLPLLKDLGRINFILPSCVLMAHRLVHQIGSFDEALLTAEDWDLWMRIVCAGHPVYGVPGGHLCWRRSHPGGNSRRYSLLFWTHQQILARLQHVLPPDTRRGANRIMFRNVFTWEGDAGRFQELTVMFDAYRPNDADGYACRVMAVLRHLLPVRAFWFVSRYAVIPLAWHLERWGERCSFLIGRSEFG